MRSNAFQPRRPAAIAIAMSAMSAMSMCAASATVLAQAWPVKPVRMVVPYPPGGSTDISARLIAEATGKSLGQNVLVDNRPGAGGMLGMELVARAAPDGYTQIVSADSAVYQPTIRTNVRWAIKDFAPVSQLVSQPIILAVNPGLGVSSVADLVRLAKAQPGSITYGTGSASGTQTLAAAVFADAAGIKLRHVPYKGGAQAGNDLAGGHINAAFLGSGPLMAFYRSGRVRLLAVTSKERSLSLKDVPTVAESGYPDVDITQWFGMLAPAGTPAAIVNRMQVEIARAMAQPDLRDKLLQTALDPVGSTPQAFAARIESESKLWARAVKELGMPIED